MSGSSSLQRITTRTSTSRAPFNPPPLPPRPAKAALPDLPQSPPQASRTARPGPPPLPPRPRTDPIVLAANEPFYGSVPPSDPDGDLDEEKTGLRIAPSVRRFRFYPRTRRGRWWFWGILSGLVIAVAIVIAVCVTQIRHTDSTSISTNSGGDNGGHPLPIADGGPTIGKPGDIPTFGTNSTDHFLLRNNRSIVVTRLDPIVNPGAIGSHVHRVYGSSFFTPNLTSATEAQKVSDCTTVPVQDDRSAYWVASVYYRYPNGSLVAIPLDHHSAYYFMKAPTGVPIYAFPDNYNIVAGNPYRRSFNNSDRSQGALWFTCNTGAGDDDTYSAFPPKNCPGGINLGIQFPSCWDGLHADDADYSTHVAYPTDGTNGFHCPAYFPKKFITVQFETTLRSQLFPFNGKGQITWVLANGDTTGYGLHADFMNGWNPTVLQNTIDNCRYMNGTSEYPAVDDPRNCPALFASWDLDKAEACRFQNEIINEAVGEQVPLVNLPGCNALWSGNVSKPACPAGTVDGGDLDLVQPSVWYQGEPYIA